MANCEAIRTDLTAHADGQRSRWRQWRAQRHCRRCRDCEAHAGRIAQDISDQAILLTRALAVPDLDADAMRRKTRILIAALPREDEAPTPVARWYARPALALATLLLAIAVGTWQAGGTDTVLITLGILDPPSTVAHETELFQEYRLIQHLDALENFDSVNSVPLDEGDRTSSRGSPWVG